MYRHGSHTISRLTVHIVWITKYLYHVLTGDVQKRCRELLIQLCESEDVSKDHVHMHIEYPCKSSVSEIVKRLKGATSRKLQMEFSHLAQRYWGRHFWGIGYGAWSTGNITEEIVQQYLEHHRDDSSPNAENLILE